MSESLFVKGRRDWQVWWSAGFGSGFLRPAPGTWGSALAVLIWWFGLAHLPWWQQALVIAVFTAFSTWCAGAVCARYGVNDAPEIVTDEFAGAWIALLAAPAVWWVALAGFVLFRVFDILKPPPVGWADRQVKGAVGIMLDDLLAGCLAAAVLQVSLLVLADTI